MTNLNSLFLSQAYKDCWDDYNRSLKLRSFPRWDYVILTASNEQQAEGFRKQIADRQNFLPRGTKFIAIPDRDGRRVGSGGATLEVLRYLHEQEGSFDSLRVLVIHSGGDSKRVPQYSALGKLFSPVPHELPNGRSSTLFDEFMICMSSCLLYTSEKLGKISMKRIVGKGLKIAFIFSFTIEMLQLFLRLGTWQISDLCYNTVGGGLGGALFYGYYRLKKEKRGE